MTKYQRDNNSQESRDQQASNKDQREESREMTKTDGKVEPLKMTPEELEKRRETGYRTNEEADITPDERRKAGNKMRDEEA